LVDDDVEVDVDVVVDFDGTVEAHKFMNNEEITLAHERLNVYQCAIEFLALASTITDALPARFTLSNQLQRAYLSIPLNIAEGAGKPNGSADAKRSYNIARGSAMECGAILDSLKVMRRIDEPAFHQGKHLLVRIVRIVSMLTKM
jgi:four helix bundle protein